MIRSWLFPLVAVLGIAFAIWTSLRSTRPTVAAPAANEPPKPAFATFIAGAGLVESASENIAIGTPVPGIVTSVPLIIGQQVAAGAPLVQLDDRPQRARLAEATAQLAKARAQLARLKALPRAEDLPPAEARINEARTTLSDAKDQFDRAANAATTGSISDDVVARRRFAVHLSEARLEETLAAAKILQAGAWAPDLTLAEADIVSAESQVATARAEVERLAITAPIAGTILTLDVRPGQFAAAGPTALLTLGDTSTLNVRVDLDEQDSWRMAPHAAGIATVRGNSARVYHLTWLRTEPYVRPKKSLTGDSTERVDTRVLQVIYRIEGPTGLYVGQQMDVQIEAAARPPNGGGVSGKVSGSATAPRARPDQAAAP